jgi:glycogen operon protein
VNFVTAHDGFTLEDLVSCDNKHNEANLEDNLDGSNENFSWNHGAEGPTNDPAIARLREQQKRNMLTTLFLSQGVPMLVAGDEMGRTQNGNNNAYCQDNDSAWLDWSRLNDGEHGLHDFVRRLIALRRDHIVFHRYRFFLGRLIPGTKVKDITWLNRDGRETVQEDWEDAERRCLGALVSGLAGDYHLTARGRPEPDDTFLMLLNSSAEEVEWTLPAAEPSGTWRVLIDSASDDGTGDGSRFGFSAQFTAKARSIVVMILDEDGHNESRA